MIRFAKLLVTVLGISFYLASCSLMKKDELGDSYTLAETTCYNWDATWILELSQDLYSEEILKAQNGEAFGKYVVVKGLKDCTLQAEQARSAVATAKARILKDGLKKEEGLAQHPRYRCIEVQSAEDADFSVAVYLSFLFDNYTIQRDYYRFVHNEPIEYAQPEAVDLGLDVLWASFNVGAVKPESFGGFYAWGETVVKEDYSKDNYKWWDGSKYTKYFQGTVLDHLEATDDAATVNLGNGWRTPTKAEFESLMECEWTVDTLNSVRGCTVTGQNGNSIFIPMAGAKDEKGANTIFSFYGNYHTDERYGGELDYQYYFRFHGSGQFIFEDCASEGALPVRAVKDK